MVETDASDVGLAGLAVLVGTVLSMFGGFLLRIVLARNMTSNGFGIIVLFLSILNIFSIVTLLGLNRGVVKYTSSNQSNRVIRDSYITASLGIPVFLSVVVGIIVYFSPSFLISYIFGGSLPRRVILLLCISLPLFTIFKMISATLRGTMNTKAYTFYNKILQPMVKLTAVSMAIVFSASTVSVVFALAISYSIITFLGILILYRLGWTPTLKSFVDYNSLIKYSLPLLFASSVYILLTNFDKLFIAYYLNPEGVARYEVAIILATLLGIFKTGFSFLIFPKISEKVESGDEHSIEEIYQQTTKWILLFTTPAVMVIIYRPEILVTLFGGEYSVSVVSPVLSVLAIGFFFNAIVGPNSDALLGFGRSFAVLKYNTIAVGLNVLLNVILIPEFGIFGAALASLFGYVSMNLLKSVDLFIYHKLTVIEIKSVIMSGATLVFGTLLSIIFPQSQSPVVEFGLTFTYFVLTAVTGLLVLWMINGITISDKAIVHRVYRKFSKVS